MPKTNELSKNVNNSSVQAPLFADETAITLTKESNEATIKKYFEAILSMSKSIKDYPINLNSVWGLAYSAKEKAVRALKANFIEGIDYEVLAQNGENPQGGRPTDVYMLSIPCLEYFIARKVRPVFEVYRKVFHKVVTGRKEVIYTEREVKKQLMDAERQVRESAHINMELQMLNHELKAKVKVLTSLYEEEVMKNINTMVFIEGKRLTEELKAYLK